MSPTRAGEFLTTKPPGKPFWEYPIVNHSIFSHEPVDGYLHNLQFLAITNKALWTLTYTHLFFSSKYVRVEFLGRKFMFNLNLFQNNTILHSHHQCYVCFCCFITLVFSVFKSFACLVGYFHHTVVFTCISLKYFSLYLLVYLLWNIYWKYFAHFENVFFILRALYIPWVQVFWQILQIFLHNLGSLSFLLHFSTCCKDHINYTL